MSGSGSSSLADWQPRLQCQSSLSAQVINMRAVENFCALADQLSNSNVAWTFPLNKSIHQTFNQLLLSYQLINILKDFSSAHNDLSADMGSRATWNQSAAKQCHSKESPAYSFIPVY
ncbi:uncharacterized protein LOC108594945 [Drosophila busckii]|uniref:uncharacterized protein LOC108594945 n=1 Tax=Drosophila busckii TaxID=30019 RepID=UPI00083EEC44|nr:uncharacterized protein LOC108594945 [Drosophila busckii]